MGDNWEKAKQIFAGAIKLAPELRLQYVNDVCANDADTRREVESLLSSYDDAENFMEMPAAEEFADVIKSGGNKLETGKCLGHYEIIKQIGAGGMGEVYLAKDKKLDRKVAIKILNEKFAQHESNLQRFISEAKAASALNHPNILTIYDFSETEDIHFIVSEFINGKTLRQTLKEKSFKFTEILDISIQIANALSAAHEAHLVHRDIKPENIMIRHDGFVKILDFGLAKLIQPRHSIVNLEDDTIKLNVTAKGIILGTVNYMSPEQAKGERIDERADIFSLGAMIYEMLTGKTPFQGNSTSETFTNLFNAEPQPLAHFGVPDELQHVVSKMINQDKGERYQTMKELLVDLKNLQDSRKFEGTFEKPYKPETEKRTEKLEVITDEPKELKLQEFNDQHTKVKLAYINWITENRWKYRAVVASGLVLILTLAGLNYGLYLYIGGKNKSPFVFKPGKATRFALGGRVKNAAVSPDGKYIIYAQEEKDGLQSLWKKQTESESNQQIAPPNPIVYRTLDISPDGNSFYYTDRSGYLYRMPASGGTPKRVLDNFNGNIGFSPDGEYIAFRRNEKGEAALFIADTDGSNERKLVSFKQLNLLEQPPSWSPDGKIISCRYMADGKQNIMAVQVADGTAAPILTQGWNFVGHHLWLPDEKSLLIVGIKDEAEKTLQQIWRVSYPGGEVHRVTDDTNNYESITIPSDGRFLITVRTEPVANIWVMSSDATSSAKQLTEGFESYDGVNSLSWTAEDKIVYDSSQIVFSSVLMMEADGKEKQQLMNNFQFKVQSISFDGRYLIYQNKNGLMRFDLNRREHVQLTEGMDSWATFSPDGKWVVYRRYDSDNGFWMVPVEGGKPIQILRENGKCPSVSFDGKMVAFILEQIIAVGSFNSGKIIKYLDTRPEINNYFDKQNLQWTPDGRAINYVAMNNGVSNIWRQPIDGKGPVQITKFDSGRIFNFAFSHDGKHLALSRGSLYSDVVLIKNAEK